MFTTQVVAPIGAGLATVALGLLAYMAIGPMGPIERDYPRGTHWSVLTQENVDARVWAGAHYRYSDTTLGRRVADYDLRRLNA